MTLTSAIRSTNYPQLQKSGGTTRASRLKGRLPDLAVLFGFLVLAVLVTVHLWRDPTTRIISENSDQTFFEWTFMHVARALETGSSPLLGTAMNHPHGVNMMANTSMLAISVPLTPITLLLGPAVSFVIALTLGLALTGFAWYLFFSRGLGLSRVAAVVGGTFCGFAPGMISHTNAHPNIISQFLVPIIIWRALELFRPRMAVRNGTLLALVVCVQAFINEEVLLLIAVVLGLWLGCMALTSAWRNRVREMLLPLARGLAVAVIVAGLILAYPLWFQFTGPGSYSGMPSFFQDFRTDLFSHFAFARRSLAGDADGDVLYALNSAEQNSFFGWPLVLLCTGLVYWMRRRPEVMALAVTATVCVVFSLGDRLVWKGTVTAIRLPWVVMKKLPLFDSVLPTRWSLTVIPLIAVLLALGVHELLKRVSEAPYASGPALPKVAAVLALAACAVALIPLLPRPIRTTERPSIPGFFSSGQWREFVPAGYCVVPVPPTLELDGVGSTAAMRWSTSQQQEFPIAGGYYLAGDPESPENTAMYGNRFTHTTYLIWLSWQRNEPIPTVEYQRAAARDYFASVGAAVVVLPVGTINESAVRTTLDGLLGPGILVDDVWLWDVRQRQA